MSGGGANQQQNSADQYYQQEANNANTLMQQYQNMFLPIAKNMIPLLSNTLNGQNTSLTQAAMAPVNAETSRALNTMQNNVGGYTNPDAAMADIALGGQQNAGLAGDNLVSGSLQSLLSLFGMGQQGAGMGMSGLNSAGGGEANLGSELNQQQNQFWNSLLSGIGQGAGMYAKGGAGGGGAPSSAALSTPSYSDLIGSGAAPAQISQTLSNPYLQMAQMQQPGLSVDANNQSTPISGNAKISGVPSFGNG
jgi:hypothetical protein